MYWFNFKVTCLYRKMIWLRIKNCCNSFLHATSKLCQQSIKNAVFAETFSFKIIREKVSLTEQLFILIFNILGSNMKFKELIKIIATSPKAQKKEKRRTKLSRTYNK